MITMDPQPTRKAYRSDLTDQEWDLIKDFIPAPKHGPNPWKYPRREIVNAIRYKLHTGCQWEYLPHDLPPWKSVSDYFYLWRDDGTWMRLTAALRGQVRRKEGRAENPSLGIVDSQSVKSVGGCNETGIDAGKRVNGRKRHVVVDILGLLIVVFVTAASASDQSMIRPLAMAAKAASPRLTILIGDTHYQGPMADDAARAAALKIEVRDRTNPHHGFQPIPLRWHVEQSFGWMNHWRELSKEYTHNPRSSEAWIQIGFIGLMSRRLSTVVESEA
jgi:putative transposase